jgi:hypothetical protein
MPIIKKYSPKENLSSFNTLVVDNNPNSDYFRITEFKDTFTSGRNGFLIEGSEYLRETTEIKIEILDVEGNPLYFEPGNGIPEYYEGISKPIAVYIYQDTPIGLGKITILGEAKKYIDNDVVRDVPDLWKGIYNVKWERTFQINKNLNNSDRVRFYRKPKISIDEITKPVLQSDIISVTQTGTANGIPLSPVGGTNLQNYTLPTNYRIIINDDSNWTGSVTNQVIDFPTIGYSATIDDVVNSKEVLVGTPYAFNNEVTIFDNEPYSVTFNYVEGSNTLATALTGSYARIKVTDLKTFIGDVARVKIYRKSQSQVNDFEFVQEVVLNADELLVDYENPASNQELYGTLTPERLTQYWVTSSNNITAEFNQTFLYNSVRLDSTASVENFLTSKSIDVTDDLEYTFNMNIRKSGSVDDNSYVRVYLSGSVTSITSSYTTNESGTILTNRPIEIFPSFAPTAVLTSSIDPNDWYVDYGLVLNNLRPGRYYEVVTANQSGSSAGSASFGSDFYSVSASVAELAITDGFFALDERMEFTNFWRVRWTDVTDTSAFRHFDFQIFDKYDDTFGKFINGVSDYRYEFNLQDSLDALPFVSWSNLPTFDDVITPKPYVSDGSTTATCKIGPIPFDGVDFGIMEYPLEISGLVSGSLYKISNIFTSSTARRNAKAYIGSDFYDMVDNSFTASSEVMLFDKAYAITYETGSYQPEDNPFAQIAFKIEKVDNPTIYGSVDIGSGSLNISTKLSDNPSSGSNYSMLPNCGYIGFWPRPSVESIEIGGSSQYLISPSTIFTSSATPTYLQVEQDIIRIGNDVKYLDKVAISENFIVDRLDNAQIYFEVSGSGWHISDVSLKAAQEKGYSPDEITFIQSVPKTLPKERFDFRFEFYDINNNYIPVTVDATKLFDGGNLSSFQKSIELIPSSLYFSFDSASNPQPPTVIQFTTITNLITGSVTYTSASYDITGSLIPSESYVGGIYPGLFTVFSDSGSILTANNFTGSDTSKTVQYIEFTAEAEGLSDSVIITRVLDGRGGVNYDIRSYNGTVIKNSSTAELEFQAIRVDGVNQIELSSQLPQPELREYKLKVLSSSLSGDVYIPISSASAQGFLSGVSVGTLGSGEIDYNVKIGRDAVSDQLVLYLMSGNTENDILTSIVISDLQDGLTQGFLTFTAEQFKINLGAVTSSLVFSPPSASAIAHFYERGTNTNPLTASVIMTPSMSIDANYQPEFFIFYTGSGVNSKITFSGTNEIGELLPTGFYTSSATQSEQLNLSFTYTEDYTGAQMSLDKAFYIVREGVPGQDAVEILIEPTSVNLSGDEDGTVFNYTPANTRITMKQNNRDLLYDPLDLGSPGTFTASISSSGINVGTVTTESILIESTPGSGIFFPSAFNSAMLLRDHSNMVSSSAEVTYTFTIYPFPILGREDINVITPVVKKQTFNKTNDGRAARNVTLTTTSDVVTFDGDGVVISPAGSIFLTATPFNVTGTVYYQFFRDGFAYSGIDTQNTFEIGSGDATSPGETATWKVEIRDGASNGPVVGIDEVTIVGIKAGSEAYNVILTNENSAVNVAVDGDVDFSGTGTEIRAYKGPIELTHVSTYSAPTLDLQGNEIGVLGEFSSSVYFVSNYITQNSTPTGNPATIGNLTGWTDPQTNVSGFIVYKVDIEDGRATFFKTQSFTTQFEGAIGPGIVMRGEWTGSIDYIFDIDAKRRDAVLREISGDVHYWATTTDLVDAGSPPYTFEPVYNPGSPPSQGDIDAGGWQYLGMQEFFVAAKIAIFEESFVKNTINVGIPPADKPNANIAIVGGTSEPYIAIGQQGTQGYNQEGIWLGINEDGTNGTYGMMSLKGTVTGGSYNALTWDGETLTIRGAIRQLDSGDPEGRVLGAWQDGYVYLQNDIVTYNGQSWQATSSHTSNALGSGTDGPPGIGPWVVAAQAGTSGTDGPAGTSGAAAKSVRLTSEAYVIQYDANGNNPSPSGNIKLEASSSNFTNGYFKFTGGGTNFSDEASYTDGISANNDFATLTIPSTYFATPLTFRVGVADGDQVELANDGLTVVAVKPGADVDPQYIITPKNGTVIKNGTGTLELQVQQSDSTGLSDVTTGWPQLYTGSTLLTVGSGITAGANGVTYNPIFAASAIYGSTTLLLKDIGGNVLDSITLVDVTDGLGGGAFNATSLTTIRQNGTYTYTPSFISATASFFDTKGLEFTSSFKLIPSASGLVTITDYFYFEEGFQDPQISYVVNNGDGQNYAGPGQVNALPTKDISIRATFTDLSTGQTTNVTETFNIVSDGADGIDALTIVNTNPAHTVPASSAGVVSNYSNSGTIIQIYEGINKLDFTTSTPSAGEYTIGTPRVSPSAGITVGNIEVDGNTDASASNHSAMDNSITSVVITYPITGSRIGGEPFLVETTQTIAKSIAGVTTKALTVTTDAGAYIFDDEFDNAAADPTIRVYINQQNLSGTIVTGDITIVDALANTLTTPSLTGTVTSGTGQQYFDLTFDTGSSGTGYIDAKNKLPVSITVSKDSITDATSIAKLEGGATNAPMYFISPISGSQIKNSVGTLYLEILESGPGGITKITSGDKKLYVGGSLITTVVGVSGTDYAPVITATAINGELVVTLKDGTTTYDSITLLDVTDGLGGGSFIGPTLNTTRQNGATTYTPTFLSITASFFDVGANGVEHTSSFRFTPYFDGVDYFYYDLGYQDPNITFTINDGDGNTFTGTGFANKLPTKDVNITATYTPVVPAFVQSSTITETLYIVSDGQDGVDALTIISTNQSHTLPASSLGVVGNYDDSGTRISLYEGTSSLVYDGTGTSPGTWKLGTAKVSPAGGITVGSYTDLGDDVQVGNYSNMNNALTSVVVTYPITGSRLTGGEFRLESVQTLTKAPAGVSAKALTVTSDAQVYVFDDSDDNAAADPTIRVYINQQNLTGTITTSDVTITTALAGTLTVPTLLSASAIVDGTGEMYFDLTFDTGSSGTGYIDNKNKLPVTITVQKDSITDSTSLSKLEGGASNAPMYFISPLNGTQIKNGAGSLSFQILESAPGAINVVTSGNIKIYSGSNLITTYGGVTGTDYAPTIPASAIQGTSVLTLKDLSTTYDSVTLVDVTDGLGGGSFLATSLNTNRQPNGTYLPTFLSATASFFDVNGTEYTSSFKLVPSLVANTDYFHYETGSQDPNITFTMNNGDNQNYSGEGAANKLPTKDINIVATFTDPNTNATNTITETFYIVSDGEDGLDAITIINSNGSHTVPASAGGVVGSYTNSGTEIRLYEGIDELTYIPYSITTIVSQSYIFDGYNDGDKTFTFVDESIDTNAHSYSWVTSSITPLYLYSPGNFRDTSTNDPVDYAEIDFFSADGKNVDLVGTEELGTDGFNNQPFFVTLVADKNGTISTFVSTSFNELSASSWTISSSLVAPSASITVGSITDSGTYATIGNHSNMSAGANTVQITYNIQAKRSNEFVNNLTTTQTITKALGGQTGSVGPSGAGVVYRGEWNSTTEYVATTERKDIVKYSTNTTNPYWITKTTHTNQAPPATGTTGNTYWDSFGAQFTSVATDILFAQDVYANRTVNIGTSGSSPVIALNSDFANSGANPKITMNLGNQGYAGTNGIFLGFDSSVPKMSLVNNNGTKFVKWTGSDLEVKGNIRADEGVIGGLTVTSSSLFLSGSIPPFIVSQSGYFKVGGEPVEGVFTPLGDITSLGAPTSWATTTVNGSGSVDSNYILRDSGGSGGSHTTYVGFDITGSGQLFYLFNIPEQGDGLYGTSLQKANGTWSSTPTTLVSHAFQGVTSGSLNITSGKFRVAFSDNSVSSFPTLQIAQLWYVSDAYFEFNPETDTITAGNALLTVGQGNGKLTIGGTNPLELENGNFVIDQGGNIQFAGDITATSGEIGGFTITDTELYADDISIGSDGVINISNGQVTVKPGALGTINAGTTLVSNYDFGNVDDTAIPISFPTTIYNGSSVLTMSTAAVNGNSYEATMRLDNFTVEMFGDSGFLTNGYLNGVQYRFYIDILRNDGTTVIKTQEFSINRFQSPSLGVNIFTYGGDDTLTFTFDSPASETLKYRLRYRINSLSYSTGGGTVYNFDSIFNIDTFTITTLVGKTEISDGGIQTIVDTNTYFKVNRDAANNSVSTPFIILATDSGYTSTGNIIPLVDNTYDLGTTTGANRRWDDIYATNATIQTSDIREKDNVNSTDLGLQFIKDLRPVSYKWIGKQRTHFGFIAQEVNSTLESYNKSSNDFAGLITGSTDESAWGLRYNEFIAPMVKAIQELSEKVERLEAQISGSNNT